MRRYILTRLLLVPLVLLGVSVLSFALVRVLPGDAALVRLGASNADCIPCRVTVEHELGLDQPAPVQYLRWLGRVVRGDFGISISTSRPINTELRTHAWLSVELSVLTVVFSL